MKIGEKIKKLRKQKGLTQEEVAKAINSTKQTIYKYETGVITNIPSDKIEAISELLNCSPSYLMGWENENINPSITAQVIGHNGEKISYNDEEINNDIRKILDGIITSEHYISDGKGNDTKLNKKEYDILMNILKTYRESVK